MPDNSQDKTEYQSQKKLEESRERGELPRSPELATFAVFAVVILYFSMGRLSLFDGLGSIVAGLLQFDRHMDLTRENLGEFFLGPTFQTLILLGPLFVLVLILSPLISMGQTGFTVASKKL